MRNTLPTLLAALFLAQATLPAESVEPAAGRAVSLTALETRLRTGRPSEVARLCGITRISGYIADVSGHDIVLVGEVEPDRPALYLDDLAVAFRNSRLMYAQRKGRTIYYTAPGCSIDPDPSVMQDLDRLSRAAPVTSDRDERRLWFDKWQAVGSRPQNVRVLGVPFDSRFAKVMVDADYYMKRLTDGSVALGIEGFESLMEMRMRTAKNELSGDRSSSVPTQSLNRFWFCPGESTFTEEDGAVLLRTCRVKLLTEEEFLTTGGVLSGKGRPDPLARRFADSFSAKYDQIASRRPIYRDLSDLFRLVAVAKLLDDTKLASVGVKLPYLMGRYQVKTTPVSRAVTGLTSLKEIEETKETSDGTLTMYMWLMSCGGVNMDVHPKRVKPVETSIAKTAAPRTSGTSAGKSASVKPPSKVKKAVLTARKSKDSLYWDFGTKD